MMQRLKSVFLLVLVLPHWVFAANDIKLTASVDNPSPRVGERFTYSIQADYTGSLPDIAPPDFDGFEIAMGPSVSTSVQIINMAVSKSQTISYVLRPTRSGTLSIAPASLKLKSKTISSNSVSVEVPSDGTSPNPGAAAGKGGVKGGKDKAIQGDKSAEVFLTATADKLSLTKLDMAIVTYRLYLRVNVLNYEIAKVPQATGFWIEDFPVSSRPVLEDVTVDGQPYKSAVIRRIGVFPTRSGAMMLDPLSVDVTIERSTRRARSRDPFDSFFDDPFFGSRGQRVTQTVSCVPLMLSVRDFPAGAPAEFSGDVGSFDLNVTYDKQELAQNDALTVKVTISGKGYLKSIDAPKLELPSGFEQFAPTTEDNISLASDAMRGKKSFTYLVIPRRSGNFTLPPVRFSYFDPAAGSYKTASDGGLDLRVSGAEGGNDIVYSGKSQSEVTLVDSDIRFVKALTTPLTKKSIPQYRSPWFIILFAMGPLSLLGGIGWEKYNEKRSADPVAVRRRKAVEMVRKSLIQSERFAQSDALKAVETAAKGLAELTGAVIDEPTAGLTMDLVRRKLNELNADADLTDKTIKLLGEADRIRFGGAGQTVNDIRLLLEDYKTTAANLERLK